MKKRKYIIIIASAVIVISVLYFAINSQNGDFSTIAGIATNKTDKIFVQSDWGNSTTITSKDKINAVINYLDSYNYKRVF